MHQSEYVEGKTFTLFFASYLELVIPEHYKMLLYEGGKMTEYYFLGIPLTRICFWVFL